MVRDLSDPYDARRRQTRDVRRLMASTAIQNTAVDRGALRVKSEEGLEVGTAEDPTGSQFVYGILRIIGQLIGDGQITWSGPWRFTGNGAITGDVVAEGKWTQNGPWEFNGPGDIAGDVDLTGDLEVLGNGQVKVGNVLITPGSGGRVTVGVGSAQVVLNGDDGTIQAGSMTIDPTEGGGAVVFDNGAQLYSSPSGNQIEMFSGDAHVTVQDDQVSAGITGGVGNGSILLDSSGVRILGAGPIPTGRAAKYLAIDDETKHVYATAGVGGGGGSGPGPIAGSYMWPFSQSATDPVIGFYGMRINPVSGQWRLHAGQDFTVPYGSSIPAAGDGQIASVGFDSGRGNYVIIDHGNGISTHYFHMAALSQLQVGDSVERGARIGAVGSTGNSTGAHLHWETHVNGTAIDPRQFMASQTG